MEDVIATKKGHTPLYIQAKNYQDGSGLDQDEQYLFLWHAEDYGCIPIYLSVPKRGQRLWLNLIDNKPIELYPFTKEWVQERSVIKKMLSDLKNPKKGGSRKKWKRYVMDHYQQVKQFIC